MEHFVKQINQNVITCFILFWHTVYSIEHSTNTIYLIFKWLNYVLLWINMFTTLFHHLFFNTVFEDNNCWSFESGCFSFLLSIQGNISGSVFSYALHNTPHIFSGRQIRTAGKCNSKWTVLSVQADQTPPVWMCP